jgi:outer membrane lipoprotein-sorting protein
VGSRLRSRSSCVRAAVLAVALGLTACTSIGREPEAGLSPEAEVARAQLERRWHMFGDLRTLADLSIKRGDKAQRLTGPLLLRAPGSLRFEALTPMGLAGLVVTSDTEVVTIWEVLQNRAYLLSATPDANSRWLGLSLGAEDLVALLSGNVRPLPDASSGRLMPDDALGSSLSLSGSDGTQRIWFAPETWQPRQVEWTGGRLAARVTFTAPDPAEPPQGLVLAALDGSLEVTVRYRNPRFDTGLDSDLLRVKLPEDVRIRDYRH